MKIKQMLILCVFACSLVHPVFGATTYGVIDCGEWINKKKNGDDLFARTWLLGHMSGLNVWNEFIDPNDDPLSRTKSADQIFLFIDNYCLKNPRSNVSAAGVGLFLELMKKK